MSDKPAFPYDEINHIPGMTLREYELIQYRAAALQGLISNTDFSDLDNVLLAKYSHQAADAMIEHGENHEPK